MKYKKLNELDKNKTLYEFCYIDKNNQKKIFIMQITYSPEENVYISICKNIKGIVLETNSFDDISKELEYLCIEELGAKMRTYLKSIVIPNDKIFDNVVHRLLYKENIVENYYITISRNNVGSYTPTKEELTQLLLNQDNDVFSELTTNICLKIV